VARAATGTCEQLDAQTRLQGLPIDQMIVAAKRKKTWLYQDVGRAVACHRRYIGVFAQCEHLLLILFGALAWLDAAPTAVPDAHILCGFPACLACSPHGICALAGGYLGNIYR